MRSLALDILRALAESGTQQISALGLRCDARRTALRRELDRLAAAGWVQCAGDAVHAAHAYDFLDGEKISQALAAASETIAVSVADACPSTNSALLGSAQDGGARLLLAEEQTAGRGRRGRRWMSPVGTGLALSLARPMRCSPRDLPALSLAAGVAAIRALRRLGLSSATLKWPNDLMLGEGKLGGILAETRIRGEAATAVIGIGLNCRRVPGLGARLRRQVASLEDGLHPLPARNAIAAALAGELLQALAAFEAGGLAPFRAEWDEHDACRGRRLRVRTPAGRVLAGFGDGLAEDGALRLRTRRGVSTVLSGHVVGAVPA